MRRTRSLKATTFLVITLPASFRMLPSLPRLSNLPIIRQPFKRSQEGLFHGKMKQYGNNVPHSKHKTRRTWLPNVRSKRLPLKATGETVKLKVTTRALKCIKKVRFVPVQGHIVTHRLRLVNATAPRLVDWITT